LTGARPNMRSILFERLREALPDARFGPPAELSVIERVETELGMRFPRWLRELYLHCDGIQGGRSGPPYLYPLEPRADFGESVLGWNKFQRELWNQLLPEFIANRPDVDLEKAGPERLLFIGSDRDLDWAIEPESGEKTILGYDVRSAEVCESVADDLVEACVRRERERHELNEDLFRGRRQCRSEAAPTPPANDVERLYDIIVELHRPRQGPASDTVRTGWYLDRITSQRPGELGELHVFDFGSLGEIRIASRDGNAPLLLRLRSPLLDGERSMIAWDIKTALMCILRTKDALNRPYVDDCPQKPNEAEMNRIWRSRTAGDAELERMADVLCARDDARRHEENELG
jgi:hypothetical protein